jgi:hypothetical protein
MDRERYAELKRILEDRRREIIGARQQDPDDPH